MRHYNIPIFLPHAACPFRCVFCDQHLITSRKELPSFEEARKIIEETLTTIPENAETEIAFFGGSFTALPMETQENYLKLALPYLKGKRVRNLRISTRPDFLSDENLALLKAYEVRVVELGIQSFDDAVLKASGRGYSAKTAEEACQKIKANGFVLGIQLMPGLPGDTEEKSLLSAKKAIALGAEQVRIYPTVVLKGTTLAAMAERGLYTPISLDWAIETAKKMKILFDRAEIPIIRLGLYVGEDLQKTENVLGGGFHPALGERVEQKIFLEQARMLLGSDLLEAPVKLIVNKKDLSKLNGYKKENKLVLEALYRQRITFKGEEADSQNWISVCFTDGSRRTLTREEFLKKTTV